MATSAKLGPEHTVDLPAGRIRYHDLGEGPTVVFVHGFACNADLWTEVVEPLVDAGYRCVLPDWPMGSHIDPVRDGTPLGAVGLADVVADFLDALDLQAVTLVANDSGDAVSQVLVTRRPDRVARLVLTSGDAFDNMPPPPFPILQALARIPGMVKVVMFPLRWKWGQRLPLAYGWVSKRPMEPWRMRSFLRPATDPDILADLREHLLAIDKRDLLAATQRLGEFTGPVLLAWSADDRLFPPEHAHRLAEAFGGPTEVAMIPDAYTYSMIDQPQALAEAMVAFLDRTADLVAA